MKKTIIIMAKAPEAGKVKTRLQPFIPPEASASLAAAMLEDTIAKAAGLNKETIISFSPSDKASFFQAFDHCKLNTQSGINLGERISSAFKFAFEGGADSALAIGTDSPTFPAFFLEEAFCQIQNPDNVVVGQTDDGGFYLIGISKLHHGLFDGIDWSTPETFCQTAANIRRLGLEIRKTPDWYDIDQPRDLALLFDEFLKDPKSRAIAPKTYRWLLENMEIFLKAPGLRD